MRISKTELRRRLEKITKAPNTDDKIARLISLKDNIREVSYKDIRDIRREAELYLSLAEDLEKAKQKQIDELFFPDIVTYYRRQNKCKLS